MSGRLIQNPTWSDTEKVSSQNECTRIIMRLICVVYAVIVLLNLCKALINSYLMKYYLLAYFSNMLHHDA